MTVSCGQLGDLVMRIQGDFLKIPGFTLTLHEAERRFGVDEVTCDAVLTFLEDAKVLTRNTQGVYLRHFPLHGCKWSDDSLTPGRPVTQPSAFSTHAA